MSLKHTNNELNEEVVELKRQLADAMQKVRVHSNSGGGGQDLDQVVIHCE